MTLPHGESSLLGLVGYEHADTSNIDRRTVTIVDEMKLCEYSMQNAYAVTEDRRAGETRTCLPWSKPI